MNEACLRGGDVYALMVEYWFQEGDIKTAYQLLQQMDDRNVNVDMYIGRHLLEMIYEVWVRRK